MAQKNSNAKTQVFIDNPKAWIGASALCIFVSYLALVVTTVQVKIVARQGTIENVMAHHFNEKVEPIFKENGITFPNFHYIRTYASVERLLAECNIVPHWKKLIYICGDNLFFYGLAFNWIEDAFGQSYILLKHFGVTPGFYLDFITELGIAKYIASTQLPSLSQVAQTTSAYCLAGQSSYVTHSGSDYQRKAILDTHLRISNLITDDISSRQQLLAFDQGWSGQDCYQQD